MKDVLWLIPLVAAAPVFLLLSRRERGSVFLPALLAFWVGFLSLHRLAGQTPPDPALWLKLLAGMAVVAGALWLGGAPGRWFSGAAAIGLSLSTVSGAVGGPGRFLRFLIETVGMDPELAQAVTFLGRKGLHFVGYGVLAWLTCRAARAAGWSPRVAVGVGLLWAVPLAAFDELTQLSSAGRTGTVQDFLLDLFGMAVFLGVQGFAWHRRAQVEIEPEVPALAGLDDGESARPQHAEHGRVPRQDVGDETP